MGSTVCKICLKESNNQNKGLHILGVHICKQCVDSMLEAKMDGLRYEDYKLAIRDIWIDYIALNY
ncbi:sigma factor G inhibitor Gin [Sporosalibacterium faouarense]|uniref:sigma factor G inhibitor Gin n=1 Tax=Sporosalibacterium faouarense TaxID=516123 RepID=UPI00141C7C3D|nr:sigma-G inhibitor, Gin [Bacillota bacterium]